MQWDININVCRTSCAVLFLSIFIQEWNVKKTNFSNNPQYKISWNFTNVGAQLFHADSKAKLIACKNRYNNVQK